MHANAHWVMALRGGGSQNASLEVCSTASQPQLPSVASVHPLRRSLSLTSLDRTSAHRCWQATLRERLGTPGEPPGREELPSLYNRPSIASAMRPPSCASFHSAPPSTAGPSASIVAWFAQFRCEGCGRIPLSLDAKFCSSCGHTLEIKLPTELQAQVAALNAGGGKGQSQSQSQPPPGKLKVILEEQSNAEREAKPACNARVRQRHMGVARKGIDGAGKFDRLLVQSKAERSSKGPGRQSRPGVRSSGGREKDWAARESQVALWLDNIKPRAPMKPLSL